MSPGTVRRVRPASAAVAAWTATLAAAAGFAALAGLHASGGGAVDLPWVPAWDLRLAFALDGLGALYALLATGIGALVFLYASAYVPRHLAHEDRPAASGVRFHALMALFMVAMAALATARDLFALFVAWDLTAVASWLLIGFDAHRSEARRAALMALLVTGVSALALLVAVLILRNAYGTTQIDEILARAGPGSAVSTAAALIAVAALAKSAQVPLHFWLPRAMAAPTPVSAYLHSAAMVAAGVLLLSRVHPLLELEPLVLDALLVAGLSSMGVGGLLALAGWEMKQVLAYSTIAQYGYVVAMLGIGGEAGAAGACFYVLAHAVAKSALFMTAGAVTEATGAERLDRLGGLARSMPLLAAGSLAAAATLAALPLTVGFFKDELFFAAALERGPVLAALAVLGAGLTLAYVGRLWLAIFAGGLESPAEPVPARLVAPVVVLGAVAVAGGLAVGPFAALAEAAARVTAAGPVAVDPGYHFDLRAENLMALAAYGLGAGVLLARRVLSAPVLAAHRAGGRLGPERAYRRGLVALDAASRRLHDVEVRDLRFRVAAVVVPGAALVTLGLVFTPTEGAYSAGPLRTEDLPLALALGVSALAAGSMVLPRGHLAMVLAVAGVGFSLTVVYALMSAPEVALVAVLIETLVTPIFVGVFAMLPRPVLERESTIEGRRPRQLRAVAIAALTGVVTTLVVWSALSRPVPADSMAERHVALADDAHGGDVVSVILADFRALDTLVEITVVAVALLGIAALLRSRSPA